jgi:putative nucleotidyltransferase with HDIG domain
MGGIANTSYGESPATQRLLEDAREREHTRLTPRERLVEFVLGGAFAAIVAAMVLLGGPGPELSWGRVAICVVTMAVTTRVIFEVGASYTTPLQVAFVPMLFLLPPEIVPVAAAGASMLGKLPEVITGRRPVGRLLLGIGNSWFAIGPAVVLALAGPGPSSAAQWPVYVAALATQFASDSFAAFARAWMYGEWSLPEFLREGQWIYLVDVLLAPVGLAIAFAAVERPWLLLTTLPLAALTMLFAHERRARISHAIELGAAYRGTALVLGNVVEADDEYTGLHCQGVVELALDVADELGLDASARQTVEFGALLHDVGKIAVPKEIINKNGPLDDAEWAIVRMHTIEGQRLLDQVGGFMAEIGRIVRSSHESFDGRGYPDGLKGEQIPLEARIVTCCDAFNAMTTNRPYRRARPWHEAMDELRRCSGTQFDPRVVEAVLTVCERKRRREDEAAALLPDPSVFLSPVSS